MEHSSDPGPSELDATHLPDGPRPTVAPPRVLAGLVVLVCGIVLAVHFPVLSAKALCFDDEQYIRDNILVRNPGWSSAWRCLHEMTRPSTVKGYYQPLTMISLMIDYRLGGRHDNLRPFHRTSLILHTCNTALVIVLLYLLFGQVWVAAGVGLVFGIHPMTVEPIAWASERKTLLASFFALWSLILYLSFVRNRKRSRHAGYLVAYLLALLSKPTALPLPLLMLLMDWWPLRRMSRQSLREKLPGLGLAAAFAVITYISQANTAVALLPRRSGLARVPLTLCHSTVFYLHKIVWPVNLSPHYGVPHPLAMSNPAIVSGVIGLCLLTVLLLLSVRWTRALLVGFLCFFIAILPTMQVVTFTNVLTYDKYAYLPSLGLLMILVWLLSSSLGRLGLRNDWLLHTMPVLLIAVVAGAEAYGTRRYLTCWRTTSTLFEHMLTIAPRATPVYNNLGNAFIAENRLQEAIDVYRRGLEIDAQAQNLHYNLGLALAKQGESKAALQQLRASIGPSRESLPALVQLAWLLVTHPDPDVRDADEARSLAQRAARLTNYSSSGVLDALAAVWAEQGHFERAVALAQKAMAMAEREHQQEVVEHIRKRLSLYRQKQPYREDPAQLWSEYVARLGNPESCNSNRGLKEDRP